MVPVDPYIRNVTVECSDPVALAAFWSAVLGWSVEPPGARHRALLEQERGPEAVEEAVTLVDPAGVETRMYFLRVPQAPVGRSSRVQFDVIVDDADAELERLLPIGGRNPVWREDRLGPFVERWVELEDPEGNVFTLQTEGATELP